MSKRLTVGMRCRFKPKEAEGHSWREYAGRECLLLERSQGSFSAMVLCEGENVPLEKEKTGVVVNHVAWVNEGDLDFVDMDFEANMDFIDWHQEHEDDFCGDCLAWFPDNGRIDPKTKEDHVCPNEDCPGRLYDSGLCPHCKVKAVDDKCPKCDFDFNL